MTIADWAMIGHWFGWGLFWLTGVGVGYLIHSMVKNPHDWFD